MAKKSKSKAKSKDLNLTKERLDSELSKTGLSYSMIAGGIIVLIGLVLIILNLAGALFLCVGVVLMYFGLKMLGYNIRFN